MTILLKLLTTWLVAAVIWLGLSALVAIPTKIFWNWLVPSIFGLPQIEFRQALGLLILTSLLFSDRKTDVRMQD